MFGQTTILSAAGIAVDRDVYIIIWASDRTKDALRQCGRWASNDQLNFTWRDAAVLGQRVGSVARAAASADRP
jgi:hypothetical protein